MTYRIALLILLPLLAAAQQRDKAPIASQPIVSLQGTVARVEAVPGQGTPYLEVKTEKGVTKLMLGAMRYLVENDFNPKAGAPIEARGYQLSDSVVAIEVTLPAEKKTLKLRDESGWPLWIRGGFGRGKGRRAGKQ
jgi:hypothetical protein